MQSPTPSAPRTPISNFSLAIVVHPQDGRFLIVQETAKHQFLWWLPGGRVEYGDSFATTCQKETLEEGGLEVNPTRLLKVLVYVVLTHKN
jgi:ADP-ribose pyrophosphatase YjhB (NUDIX family)